MRSLLIFIILNFMALPSLANGNDHLYRPSKTHRIVLPARYEDFRQQQQEESQLIPERAKDARSTGAFVSTVLDFHLEKYLEKNPSSNLHKVKSFEKTINNKTKYDADSFSIRPQLNITQMKAQIDIESLVNSRVWLDNSFRTFNAEVDVYRLEQGKVAVEYKSDKQESKTILGYKQAW